MAIDDNTSYELTGAQVKDLANKIKAKAADNTFVGATSAAPGSKGLVPQPQAGDDAKFLSGDGSWQSVTANKIDWSTLNVVIDNSPLRTAFFGGTYSKQFTVPVSGYYEISTPFSCVCHRASNNRNYLELTIDGTVEFVYSYYSVSADTDWGSTRRTVTSSAFVVYLTAGTHTIGTQGNLYYDSDYASYSALKTFYAKYFSE